MATNRGGGKRERNLREDLRDFASARPEGWDHADWLSFLEHLRERGHGTDDPEEIGRMLESERLATRLEQVQGVGPRRVEALVSRFGTLWELRRASVEEVAAVPNVPRALAERIKERVG